MAQTARSRSLILKTFLYQLVMSFFGIMMYTATQSNTALIVIGQVMVIAFYLYIFFSQSMQAGSKECEYALGHKIKSSPWIGALPILAGFIPMIVLSLWGAVQPPCRADGSYSASYAPYLLNNLLQQGVYQGIYSWLCPVKEAASESINARALLFPAAFLPGWIAGTLGYAFGWYRFKSDGKQKKAKRESGGEN